MKSQKIFLLGGIALGGWYLFEKLGDGTFDKKEPSREPKKKPKKSTKKKPPGGPSPSLKPPRPPETSKNTGNANGLTKDQQRESNRQAESARTANNSHWFDGLFDWILGQEVGRTATSEEEYQSAARDKTNWAKSGPFKGYYPPGQWQRWLVEPQTQKWLQSEEGKEWTATVQKYLDMSHKDGGLTLSEIGFIELFFPLPSSAPTIKYNDAAGRAYYMRGARNWKAKG